MPKYKRTIDKNGKPAYFVNSKRAKESDVPKSILKILEDNVELEVAPSAATESKTVDTKPKDKQELDQNKCIFCGQPATRKKFVNLQTIPLCEEDLHTHTTGEIVAQMREVTEKLQQELADAKKRAKANRKSKSRNRK